MGTVIFAGIVGVIASTLWWGWIIMLLMGVLHHEVSQDIPAIGFGPSLIIGFFLSLLFSGFSKGD